MKQIQIKVVNEKPSVKWKIDHFADQTITKLPKSEWKNHNLAKGKLKIGNYDEIFFMTLEEWTLSDYKKQWKEALIRINNCDSSCLVLNYSKKGNEITLERWLLYKINGKIHAQLSISFNEMELKLMKDNGFNCNNWCDFIPPRQTHEDDGEEIPEAIVPYES